MPLHRRLPKRGFTNIFKKEWVEVNVADLEKKFEASEAVTPDAMVDRGLFRKSQLARSVGVAVLGSGQLTKALDVTAHRFSQGAKEKIEAAGGKVSVAPTTAGGH
jgi:large subunit ribosomal protein L15